MKVGLEQASPGTQFTENLADAAQLVLANVRETHYQHKTFVKEAAGVYDMDCSGFVDYLLKRIARQQFEQLPIEPGHARPRAVEYFEFLNRLSRQPLPGWEAVDQLSQARRGDIIAWERQASSQQPGDTGHVVIIAATPTKKTKNLYEVEIYDSSGILHDDDSRPEHSGGLGKGNITFRVNESGEPTAFRFNALAHFHSEPIAIGRLLTQ
jgi:hypothetical protein